MIDSSTKITQRPRGLNHWGRFFRYGRQGNQIPLTSSVIWGATEKGLALPIVQFVENAKHRVHINTVRVTWPNQKIE